MGSGDVFGAGEIEGMGGNWRFVVSGPGEKKLKAKLKIKKIIYVKMIKNKPVKND